MPQPESHDGVDEPNCKAENVYMEWDYVDTIIAKWVRGPLEGKIVQTALTTFTADKWAKMNALHGYGVPFERASALHLKNAAWHYVEAHYIQINASVEADAKSSLFAVQRLTDSG